ncbi:MAG: hypothetical protein R3C26_18970 [Calditrichia bacterium]
MVRRTGWYDNTIAVNPYDENEVFVGGINIWRINVVNQSGNWRAANSIYYRCLRSIWR